MSTNDYGYDAFDFFYLSDELGMVDYNIVKVVRAKEEVAVAVTALVQVLVTQR